MWAFTKLRLFFKEEKKFMKTNNMNLKVEYYLIDVVLILHFFIHNLLTLFFSYKCGFILKCLYRREAPLVISFNLFFNIQNKNLQFLRLCKKKLHFNH